MSNVHPCGGEFECHSERKKKREKKKQTKQNKIKRKIYIK